MSENRPYDHDRYTAEMRAVLMPKAEARPIGGFVPLSVREGSRWKKLGWWAKKRREVIALWLAPWLGGAV